MAGYIKTMDSKHMVSIGIEGHQAKYGFGGDEGNPFVYLHQSPSIDFCTAHPYPDETWANLSASQAATLVDAWIADAHDTVGKPFVLEEFNTHSNKESYWNAMYGEMESKNAAGDNFWNYNDTSTSDFDLLHGDARLSSHSITWD
jgi:mannan endo-1,4-beta-mannosidase